MTIVVRVRVPPCAPGIHPALLLGGVFCFCRGDSACSHGLQGASSLHEKQNSWPPGYWRALGLQGASSLKGTSSIPSLRSGTMGGLRPSDCGERERATSITHATAFGRFCSWRTIVASGSSAPPYPCNLWAVWRPPLPVGANFRTLGRSERASLPRCRTAS